MKKTIHKFNYCIFSGLFVFGSLLCIDNHHFYRASNFFSVYQEPRFEECWLASFDVTLGAGATHKSERKSDRCEKCSPLLDICGLYDMQALAYDLPCKSLTNPVDLALIDLSLVPERGCFANLSYHGQFTIAEANFFYTQNFNHGVFFQLHFPVRYMKISEVYFKDLSPQDSIYPNINTPEWQTFLKLYPAPFAERFNLNLCGTHFTDIGDTSFLLGWTRNYEDTEVVDFLDFTLRFGVLTPTGRKANPNIVFDLPSGYNGHVGIPMTFDLALGSYEWLTVGLHLGVMPFASNIQKIRVKTAIQQTGLIKLDTICAKVHEGVLWDATGYVKADHFCHGLSFLIGYTYANKKANTFTQLDCHNNPVPNSSVQCFNQCDLVNSGWSIQTVQLLLEYDFRRNCPTTPRLGFYFDYPVAGHHIFKTPMAGGTGGIDFSVRF